MSDQNSPQNYAQRLEQAYALLAELEEKKLIWADDPMARNKLTYQIRDVTKEINCYNGYLEFGGGSDETDPTQLGQELREAIQRPPRFLRYKFIWLDDRDGPLFGREADLLALADLLKGGGCAAVLGVGGQGKTALAYEYLRPHIAGPGQFETVAWHTVRGGGLDLNELTELLNIQASRNPYETAELVRYALETRPTLLVLDNFEDAIQEGGTLPLDLEALLKVVGKFRGPSQLIITSRELPGGFGIKKHELKGLGAEAGADLLTENGLTDPRPKLLEVAHRAAGHPFALKLLVELVTDSHTGDTVDSLLRQRDLWDAELAERLLGKVWDTRLNEAERNLLQLMAGLRPPTRRETLLALADGPDDMQLRRMLNGLVGKGMVQVEGDPKNPRGFDLHPLLRRFVLNEKLPPDQFAARHHAAIIYFQSLIPTLPPQENYGRKSLEQVWPILEAVHHLNELGEYEVALVLFFGEKLHHDLDRFGQATLLIDSYEVWVKLGATPKLPDKGQQGVVLGNLGNAYKDLGQVEKAIEYYQAALLISKEIGDRRGEGNRLGNLGSAYRNLGQVEKAIEYYQAALLIAKEIGDRLNEGNWLGNLGNAYAKRGELARALAHWRRSVEILSEIKSPNASIAQGNIDELKAAQGEEDFARLWAESEVEYRGLGGKDEG